ncbi:MAG TPA: R3H domain-containing nucleic acid-binding protein [Bryobacteraceae bacterium]|nr:R3H domain-containing nucleic acid-binding protein [Bryobacteraceae bacterium]
MGTRKYTTESLAPRVEAFLQPVLKKAGFHLKFEVSDYDGQYAEIEDPDVVVRFSGSDVDDLLANRAELLLALEYLTMEILRVPPEDHSRLRFDANDYRLLRIEELRLSAAAAADKVRRTGQSFRFSPMTSRERRILHLAFRDEQGVRSESAGEGPRRQVVVYPEGAPSEPPDQFHAALPGRPPGVRRRRR